MAHLEKQPWALCSWFPRDPSSVGKGGCSDTIHGGKGSGRQAGTGLGVGSCTRKTLALALENAGFRADGGAGVVRRCLLNFLVGFYLGTCLQFQLGDRSVDLGKMKGPGPQARYVLFSGTWRPGRAAAGKEAFPGPGFLFFRRGQSSRAGSDCA